MPIATTLTIIAAGLLQTQPMESMDICITELKALPFIEKVRAKCSNPYEVVTWNDLRPAEPDVAEQLNDLAPAAGEHVPPLCSDYDEWQRRKWLGLSTDDMTCESETTGWDGEV